MIFRVPRAVGLFLGHGADVPCGNHQLLRTCCCPRRRANHTGVCSDGTLSRSPSPPLFPSLQVSLLLVSSPNPPLFGFFLFPLSLQPTLVPALLLLHGDQRSPCMSTSTKPTFMLTRTLLPATRAAAAMLSAVVMARMSCPLHQLWQGVFRGHHHGIFFTFL